MGGKTITVIDENGLEVDVALMPIRQEVLDIPGRQSLAAQEAVFKAVKVPGLGEILNMHQSLYTNLLNIFHQDIKHIMYVKNLGRQNLPTRLFKVQWQNQLIFQSNLLITMEIKMIQFRYLIKMFRCCYKLLHCMIMF